MRLIEKMPDGVGNFDEPDHNAVMLSASQWDAIDYIQNQLWGKSPDRGWMDEGEKKPGAPANDACMAFILMRHALLSTRFIPISSNYISTGIITPSGTAARS